MDLSRAVLLGLLVSTVVGCGGAAPGKTYYQRNIEPILLQKCAGNTSGCHSTNTDDPYSFAAGNFDVTSFENVQKRRDLLAPFGAYPYPLLLIKAGAPSEPDPNDPNKLTFQYGKRCSTPAPPAEPKLCTQDADCGAGNTCIDQFLPIDVLHNGGSIIQVGSDAFYTLQTWLENGATENGLKPPTPAQSGNGACSTAVPSGFDPMPYEMNASFATFKSSVQPILTRHGCVSGNCHGAPQSDFYITCGSDDTQVAFNFSQAWSFVDNPVDDSQILRVPLAVGAGGRGHTGGDQFASTSDPDYMTIQKWAQQVGVLDFAKGDPAKQFFKDHIQPIFLQRGCMFEACHSPAATNDFKLRTGTQGFFSAIALEKNYELLKYDFLSFEYPDPRRSRAIAKTILFADSNLTNDPEYVGGIHHRGGAVLETPGSKMPSDPAKCPAPQTDPTLWDPYATTPFCNIYEWMYLERANLGTAVTPMTQGSTLDLVYVDRPAGAKADRLQFDTWQGATGGQAPVDLMAVSATLGAEDHLTVTGAPRSLTASCGFPSTVDLGMPDVRSDGDTVVFAARTSQSTSWNLYTLSIQNGNCAPVPGVAQPDANGMHVHDFDPSWSPDGTTIVFASTRGKPGAGPTVSRKRMLPQSDLWRVKPDGTGLEQMTFLSNSELRPHFMREGRVTMTTEKASDGFYQLSGRRINWDLTDYHPLLAQRAESAYADLKDLTQTKPSIGYNAAIDIREGSDGNFLLVLYDVDAQGAPVVPGGGGRLATFNRSIGPFEMGRSDPGYLPSVLFLGNDAASGDASATEEYRAPFTMPDGQILVSHASVSTLAWELVSVNPRSGKQTATVLAPAAGRAVMDAVIAYKNPWAALAPAGQLRPMYDNRRQLVFGGTTDPSDPAHAILHMPDAPMVFTVLTGNLRRGRPVDTFRAAKYLAIYSEGMCPSTGCTANTNGIYQSRMLLGKAPLASDGSVKVEVPSETGVVLELQDGNGKPVVTMGEEHQLGPGEQISMGVSQKLFDAVCAGCHGSVSGKETDVGVTPDALTGASASASAGATPVKIGP